MKKISNTSLVVFMLIAIATIVTMKANAQGNPGGPGTNGSNNYGNGNPVGGGAPAVPFDGGMSLMLSASGISYATKKLKKKK